jgi:uncharacterized membrane-anchored protein
MIMLRRDSRGARGRNLGIDHTDLDRVAADALISRKVTAVDATELS